MSRIFLLAIVSCIVAAVTSSVFRVEGECPDNHNPGDEWFPEGECAECSCSEGQDGQESFVCSGCGAFSINVDKNECYTEENLEANYPNCCLPKIYCRGDEGFDDTKLQKDS